MNCPEYRESVMDRLAETLSADRIEECRRHEADCPACAALLEEWRHSEMLLRRAAVPTPSRDPWPAIDAAVRAPRRSPVVFWAAAAAILILGITVGFLLPPEPQGSPVEVEIVDVGGSAFDVLDGMIPGYGESEARTILATYEGPDEGRLSPK